MPPDSSTAPCKIDTRLPNSPALSTTTSASSYIMASTHSPFPMTARSSNPVADDSDDEIVWGVSDESLSNNSSENDSDDFDYVVLNKPPLSEHPVDLAATTEERDLGVHASDSTAASVPLETQMNALKLAPRSSSHKKKTKKKEKKDETDQSASNAPNKTRRRKGKPRKAGPSSESSPKAPKESKVKTSAHPAHRVGETEWFEEMAVTNFTGLGARSIVDDYSDRQSVVSYDESDPSPTLYEEASTFISSCVSIPVFFQCLYALEYLH